MPVSQTFQRFTGLAPMQMTLAFVKCFAVAHLFYTYVGERAVTRGASMLPTLNTEGDWVWISKHYRRGRDIRVGDLVTIRHPMVPHERASKRVLGMPGDYVLRDSPNGGSDAMIQVPEGHVWLAGDNVAWSRDSRTYGPVPLALVRGKVTHRLWPLSQAGRIRNTFDPVGVE